MKLPKGVVIGYGNKKYKDEIPDDVISEYHKEKFGDKKEKKSKTVTIKDKE